MRVETNFTGPPTDSLKSSLEWTGEWTVTYETFRDMGLAFAAALILIYILVVWEFGNFTMPAIIMAPIPLTLIGIVPGHWLFGASFTATSMIGFIALAGIIVRNSILLVDFSRHAVENGMAVREAVVYSCQTRTRPIIITALALVAGSSVILSDPIFQGMAISLMFGGMVSTILTLIVIPLGCVSFSKSLVAGTGADLPPPLDDRDAATGAALAAARRARRARRPIGDIIASAIITVIGVIAGVLALIWNAITWIVARLLRLFGKRGGGGDGGGPGGSPGGSPGGATGGQASAPSPVSPTPTAATTQEEMAQPTAKVAPAPKPKPEAKPKSAPRAKAGKPKAKTKTAAKAKPSGAKARGGRRGIRLSDELPGPKEQE